SMPTPHSTDPTTSSAKLSIHPLAAHVTNRVPNVSAPAAATAASGCEASDVTRRPSATIAQSAKNRATMVTVTRTCTAATADSDEPMVTWRLTTSDIHTRVNANEIIPRG